MRVLLRRLLAVLGVGLAVVVIAVVGMVATGRAAFVVTHGVSMNPLYYQGDLVVVTAASSYEVGQIVAYRLPARDFVVLHRIIAGGAGGFIIKGDNNQSTDPTTPTEDQIVGHAVLHIPQGGTWLGRLTSPPALGLIVFALLAGGTRAAQTRRRRRRATVSRHTTSSTGLSLALRTLPPALRTAAAVIATIGVLALALTALAWARPLEQAATTAARADRQMVFSYTAAVGQSAAYDSSTAKSPDPVFRALTNTVDVQFAYKGPPGSITVTAQLSTPGGWHSSIPLAATTRFTGNEYQGSVRLDLNGFDARAQAASAVTGLPAGPVGVAVTARVQTAGGPVFRPVLTLNLTPLQLALAGDAKTLTATGSATASTPARVPATLNLLGLHLTVATARTISVIVLLAVLAAAAALAVFASRAAPRDEGTAIRRRYGPLLVRVHQAPTPLGGPIIDVTEFATLAKLAERYGLLIVHWPESGVETFLVQDQNTTYRYRTEPDSHQLAEPLSTEHASQ